MMRLMTGLLCLLMILSVKHLPAKEYKTKKQSLGPNIILVQVDQWRGSAFGFMGDPNVETPKIDQLASESVRFTNAVSVCPVCTPWRASFLTGRYPTTTGMFKNDLYLPAQEYTIAEALRDAGYNTAYIGKWHLDGHGRLSFIPPERRQGFDYWKAMECTHNYNKSFYYTGKSSERKCWDGYDVFAQTRDAQEYLIKHANDEKPFFLMLSFGAPHFPHQTAPEEYQKIYRSKTIRIPNNVPENLRNAARKEAIGYYAHCSAIDTKIGELIETLKENNLLENSIIVFTSDHGEMLGSHGYRPYCKHAVYRESSEIPLLIHLPNQKEGRLFTTPITTPDLYPTLLGLAGIAIPKTVEGENIAKNIQTGTEIPDRAALIMSVSPFGSEYLAHGKPYRAIRTSRYTYAVAPDGPWLLFDHENDPLEMNNLVNRTEVKSIQKILQKQLEMELNRINDSLENGVCHKGKWYDDKWNYILDTGLNIPYAPQKGLKTRTVQSPVPLDPPVTYVP